MDDFLILSKKYNGILKPRLRSLGHSFLVPTDPGTSEHSLHQNHIEHRWNDDTKEKVMLPFMEKDNEGNAYEFGQAEGSGQEID